MPDDQGYEILHNGAPRAFAIDARQLWRLRSSQRTKRDIIELRDCATGEKLVMMTDGRVG